MGRSYYLYIKNLTGVGSGVGLYSPVLGRSTIIGREYNQRVWRMLPHLGGYYTNGVIHLPDRVPVFAASGNPKRRLGSKWRLGSKYAAIGRDTSQ